MTSRPPSDPGCGTAAILAGGLATRMGGAAKALIPVNGVALIDRQVRVLAPIFPRLLAAVAAKDDPAPYRARGLFVVTDRHPRCGPLAGLHAALEASRDAWLFVVACDMPFLDAGLIA